MSAVSDFIKTNKKKVAVFGAGIVMAALAYWLGVDVDFHALFSGDISVLGDALENAPEVVQ